MKLGLLVEQGAEALIYKEIIIGLANMHTHTSDLIKFESYLNTRVSPGTSSAYIRSLLTWFRTLNGDVGAALSAPSAQEYIDTLSVSKSPQTVNIIAHSIMRYFRWKGIPIKLDLPKIGRPEPKYLSMDQFNQILSCTTNEIEYALIIILFDTAARISELLAVKYNDIDWDNKLMTVTRKGGKREDVNISDKGLDAVRKLRLGDKLFNINYYEAWKLIKDVGKRVGITTLTPHMFRHTRARHMLMNGASIHDVQNHLGHVSIATTANIYGRFTAMDLKERIPEW